MLERPCLRFETHSLCHYPVANGSPPTRLIADAWSTLARVRRWRRAGATPGHIIMLSIVDWCWQQVGLLLRLKTLVSTVCKRVRSKLVCRLAAGSACGIGKIIHSPERSFH